MKSKSVLLSAALAACVLLVYINARRAPANFSTLLPKDKSGFAVVPPSGAVIQNPALDSLGKPRWKKQSPHSLLFGPGAHDFKKAPLSLILWTVSNAHKVKIVACFTPEKMREDPKVTMWLSGKTTNEKLDKLKILGLVWRNIGDTYYVAWDERDLPPVTPAIVPEPLPKD